MATLGSCEIDTFGPVALGLEARLMSCPNRDAFATIPTAGTAPPDATEDAEKDDAAYGTGNANNKVTVLRYPGRNFVPK